jgi:hypothetical protein
MHADLDVELAQVVAQLLVEVGDAARLQRHPAHDAVGRTDGQRMRQEVEDDLDAAAARGHQRRGQADGVDVERHVPPVVDRRGQRHAHLADDLGPQVQGVAGVLPGRNLHAGPRSGAQGGRLHSWTLWLSLSCGTGQVRWSNSPVTQPM